VLFLWLLQWSFYSSSFSNSFDSLWFKWIPLKDKHLPLILTYLESSLPMCPSYECTEIPMDPRLQQNIPLSCNYPCDNDTNNIYASAYLRVFIWFLQWHMVDLCPLTYSWMRYVTMTHFCITHNKSSFEVLSSRNWFFLNHQSFLPLWFCSFLDSSQTFVNLASKPNG